MSRAKTHNLSLVELTERDVRMFQKLNAAGWLTTRQIQEYFFPGGSANAVSKRLRKLVAGKYVAIARLSSTEPALYRLAGQGKLTLIERSQLSEKDITIPNHLPRKLKHFTAINDLRFYFEHFSGSSNVELVFFFSVSANYLRTTQRPGLAPTFSSRSWRPTKSCLTR